MLVNKPLARLGTPVSSGARGALVSEPGKEELQLHPRANGTDQEGWERKQWDSQ